MHQERVKNESLRVVQEALQKSHIMKYDVQDLAVLKASPEAGQAVQKASLEADHDLAA